MKTKRISCTINSLVTIFLTYSSHLVFSQQTSILDIDGNQLESNTKYYISTLKPGGGGGLALSVRDPRNPCPANVMQEKDQSSVGLSLKIFPVDDKQLHVSLNTDLNIAFMAATVCVQRTVWQLGHTDGVTGRRYVRSDGVLGKPGPKTLRNWFKIETYGKGYKIVYCPNVCNTCRVDCGEVGVFGEKGRIWLGLGGQPLVIAFKKVAKRKLHEKLA